MYSVRVTVGSGKHNVEMYDFLLWSLIRLIIDSIGCMLVQIRTSRQKWSTCTSSD